MREINIQSTTTAGGASTDYSEGPVFGRLYAVYHDDGTYDNNVTVTITYEGADGDDVTLLDVAAGDADAHGMFYPREQVDDNTGTAIANEYDLPIVAGVVKVVIAAGGNAKTGSERLYVLD